jgi:prepilin-type N-terminal cleavage/methylation domain-containing protein
MKTHHLPRAGSLRGFTLLELLVVIALIAALAGLVLASAGGIMKKIKRDQIRNFMAEIDGGLEDYRVDNAIYPMNPPRSGGGGGGGSGGGDVAIQGSTVLYKHLSGDFDTDGKVDENETVYVERLDYWSNSERPDRPAPETRRSVPFGDSYAVVDPLGSPVRYLAAPLGTTEEHRKEREKIKQKNPTFDLWSIAGANPDSPDFSDESTWITNWGSN